jgi:hypothetical protein
MPVLDPAAIALLVKLCAPPGISTRLIDALARVETGGDPTLPPSRNSNGTSDHGLMRINTENLGWTGLTPESAQVPCNSIAAASKVLIRDAGGIEPLTDATVDRLLAAICRYNGCVGTAYTDKVVRTLAGSSTSSAPSPHRMSRSPSPITLNDQFLSPQ